MVSDIKNSNKHYLSRSGFRLVMMQALLLIIGTIHCCIPRPIKIMVVYQKRSYV